LLSPRGARDPRRPKDEDPDPRDRETGDGKEKEIHQGMEKGRHQESVFAAFARYVSTRRSLRPKRFDDDDRIPRLGQRIPDP
jgi:hypothetical protein